MNFIDITEVVVVGMVGKGRAGGGKMCGGSS